LPTATHKDRLYFFETKGRLSNHSKNQIVKHVAHKRIGALTIGQSPRPDLVSPLKQLMPDCEIIQAGALDGFSSAELPDVSEAAYPLATQMQNGEIVKVDESFISSKLQHAQDRLETKGIAATLLLCAGTFPDLHGACPIYKPFNIACSALKALNMKSIGLITPIPGQEVPLRQRWESLGWKTTVWTADLEDQTQAFHQELNTRINQYELDCIVLDYFGHPLAQVVQLQRSIKQPVIDLGYLSMVILANTV
jgi:protein AroM